MSKYTLRRSHERGHGQHGWLDSRFSFSFADYYDPAHMGFRSLRVINDDRIAPDGGFPMHPHRDMEIVTYVIDGAVAHKDSLGNGSTIVPGEIQRMSAGSGIVHSEFNAGGVPLHLLQIWILPSSRGGDASYEQKPVNENAVSGKFGLLASPDGSGGSVTLRQDARIWLARLKENQSTSFDLPSLRGAYAHVVKGEVTLDGTTLKDGDAAHWSESGPATFAAAKDSEIMLFDLA